MSHCKNLLRVFKQLNNYSKYKRCSVAPCIVPFFQREEIKEKLLVSLKLLCQEQHKLGNVPDLVADVAVTNEKKCPEQHSLTYSRERRILRMKLVRVLAHTRLCVFTYREHSRERRQVEHFDHDFYPNATVRCFQRHMRRLQDVSTQPR